MLMLLFLRRLLFGLDCRCLFVFFLRRLLIRTRLIHLFFHAHASVSPSTSLWARLPMPFRFFPSSPSDSDAAHPPFFSCSCFCFSVDFSLGSIADAFSVF